jgi:hypothetical protein
MAPYCGEERDPDAGGADAAEAPIAMDDDDRTGALRLAGCCDGGGCGAPYPPCEAEYPPPPKAPESDDASLESLPPPNVLGP